MTRWLLALGLLAAAGPVTTDVFDAWTGERVGTIRRGPGDSVDLFDTKFNRMGWGRRNPDGSVEVFRLNGQRLGAITRDGKAIWLTPPNGGGKK